MPTAEEEKSYARGDLIFSEDTRPDGVYIVKDGLVEIFHRGPGAGEEAIVHLGRVGPRGMFGEMGLIDHQPRSASARALAPTTVLFVPKEGFQKHLDQMPPWIALLIKSLVRRLRDSNRRLVEALEAQSSRPGTGAPSHQDVILSHGDEDQRQQETP
jgi:CRP-like cAMP-binding protein